LGAAPAPESSRPDISAGVEAALSERFDIVTKLIDSDAYSLYLARDLAHPGGIGQEPCGLVRLKILAGSLASDRRQVELFHLEAKAAARLSHRNILKAAPAEEKNGIHFCVTEERPGTITLREYLKRKGWLEEGEAMQIVQQISDALEYAHGQGVLHLRLEPGNVLLDQSGTVLVDGFGVPRTKDLLWARQERSHHCAAPHISPEQILSGEVDQRSDLYLLGVIFFEMLTDRAPFESEDSASLRLKQLTRTPKAPHMFRFDLSGELSRIVMGLLGKRPDERPFDVGTFKSALEECRAGAALVEDEPEEQSSLPQITDARHSSPAEAHTDLPVAPENDRASTGIVVMPEPDAPAPIDEESVEVADAAVFADESARGGESIGVGSTTDLSEVDDGRAYSNKIVIDLFEEPPTEAREYEQAEFIGAGQVPLQGYSSRATSRPLAWLLVVLLIGGGLLAAIRGSQFFGKAKNIAAGTEQRINDEQAASKAEVSIPAPESTTLEAEKKLPPKSGPMTQAVGDTPPDSREDSAVIIEKKEAGEDAGVKPSPRKSSETSAPVDPPVEPVLTSKSAPPAEVKDVDLQDRRSLEPAPVPEQPAKAEAPAPKVIRRSGDVLQNTAVIRPRPVYPKAARDAKIRGAVTVELTIDEEGSVVAARPISGPEQLRAAAVNAARRWKWTPARVDRNRAGVVGTITFVFKD
jgi:TonB family protein